MFKVKIEIESTIFRSNFEKTKKTVKKSQLLSDLSN